MNNSYPLHYDFCILIPCYNNFPGLLCSVNSIVYDIDRYIILIVDDGSTLPVTEKEIYKNIANSPRIEVIRNSQNEGIVKALNNGLAHLKSRQIHVEFIARLDCGDTCSPDRFYKQIAFMKNNPEVDLLGTWCYFKNQNSGLAYKYTTPTSHPDILRSMTLRNVFIHPTVMWRVRNSGDFFYPENFPHAEDYGFFYEMMRTGKTAIIDEFLVTCELTPDGISLTHRQEQLKSRLLVIKKYNKKSIRYYLGLIKLRLLLILPYDIVFWSKKVIYRF